MENSTRAVASKPSLEKHGHSISALLGTSTAFSVQSVVQQENSELPELEDITEPCEVEQIPAVPVQKRFLSAKDSFELYPETSSPKTRSGRKRK